MLSSNSFHNEGTLTLNDLDEKVFWFVLGARNFECLLDLCPSFSTGFYVSILCKYSGASPCKYLYTSTKILNSFLAAIGSQ